MQHSPQPAIMKLEEKDAMAANRNQDVYHIGLGIMFVLLGVTICLVAIHRDLAEIGLHLRSMDYVVVHEGGK